MLMEMFPVGWFTEIEKKDLIYIPVVQLASAFTPCS